MQEEFRTRPKNCVALCRISNYNVRMAGRYKGSFKITDSGSMVDAVLMLKEKE